MEQLLARIVAVALLGISEISQAGSAAADFGARRHLVEPTLTLSAESGLCDAVLADAKELFDSTSTDLDVAGFSANHLSPLQWLDASGAPADSEVSIGRLDLDLDGTGTKQVVVYRNATFNWRGNWHYAYVFPNANAFDAVKATIFDQWTELSPDQPQYPDPSEQTLGGYQYYPSGLLVNGATVATGDVWAPHALFEWHGHYYFFEGTTYWDRYSDHTVRVLRLHANGELEESCRVELRDTKEMYASFEKLPAVSSFLKVIRTMGAGGEDCGTMHSGLEHDTKAKAAEWRAAIRPWAVSPAPKPSDNDPHPYYIYDRRTELFIEDWGRSELWNRREYQTYLEHIAPAQDAVRDYLVTRFGLTSPQAQVKAREVIHALTGARFLIPSGYDESDEARSVATNAINRALFDRNRQALEAALTGAEKEAISRSLANAVEWHWGLERLLRAGADPNYPNQFGKTPLMVAAHLNRIDATRALLAAGASVDAATNSSSPICLGMPQSGGRQALGYAAENASPLLMKLLLDAKYRHPLSDVGDHYLQRNPRLTDPERALGVAGLAKIAERFRGPSFDCSRAKTQTEKTICSSEVLSIFDAELSRAYAELRARDGDGIARAQRVWLSKRDKACTREADDEDSADDIADCLAELTRARIRYLHNRLSELN